MLFSPVKTGYLESVIDFEGVVRSCERKNHGKQGGIKPVISIYLQQGTIYSKHGENILYSYCIDLVSA